LNSQALPVQDQATLELIAVVLIILWLLGLVTSFTLGGQRPSHLMVPAPQRWSGAMSLSCQALLK
jgi:hypothetical protein